MPKESAGIRQKNEFRFDEPKKYIVYIHNDDFTPMDFVVWILESIFHKPLEEAYSLMLSVHHSDKAAVGAYTYDIARTKVDKAMALARQEEFPLRLSMQQE